MGMTLCPNASLQCGNDGVQNFMFYGKGNAEEVFSMKDFYLASIRLHRFRNTSESAYTGVVSFRATNVDSAVNHTALVIAKTKVALIKRLSIPRLELCGALFVTKLILHCGKILGVQAPTA